MRASKPLFKEATCTFVVGMFPTPQKKVPCVLSRDLFSICLPPFFAGKGHFKL